MKIDGSCKKVHVVIKGKGKLKIKLSNEAVCLYINTSCAG